MIKQLAWNTFKNTGNINSYLEFAELENVEKQLQQNAIIPEENKENNIVKSLGIDTQN